MFPALVPHSSVNASESLRRILIAMSFVLFAAVFELPRLPAQFGAVAQPAKPAPITVEEASEFADALTNAAQKSDVEAYNSLLDWSGIIDRATALPKSAELKKSRENFKRGSFAAMKGSGGIAGKIADDIKKGGTYKCLRINVDGKEPYVLFRFKASNASGVNYHQLFLDRNPDGKTIASDMFVFLTAERLSETFRRSWLPVARERLKTSLEKGDSEVEPLIAKMDELTKFLDLVRKQNFVDAMKIYRALPESLQKDKNTLLIRLKAAQAVSETEYAECLDDFRKFHPDDIALDFLLIDSHVIRKQFDLALKCVERTNKNVGGDAMLLVMQANLLIQLKRFPDARKSVESAILAEPDLSEAYAAGLDVSLGDQNFDETVKYLTVLEKQFGYQWKDLREIGLFEEFVKSPQYRKWAQTQK
ncbi:MAG: hypothetical protein JWN70_4406 [Planctomycetaceae bacterium]|nr:hypothetical protein [Planctomycetaceae bacterium]